MAVSDLLASPLTLSRALTSHAALLLAERPSLISLAVLPLVRFRLAVRTSMRLVPSRWAACLVARSRCRVPVM
jgi:hypothetical protein